MDIGAQARMTTITNPILPGFNPDPSILRVGDDFYIATSTFEWYPGVQIHHSRDLRHWRLASRPLARASQLDMRGNPDSCGIWAPDLSFTEGRFWLVFTNVRRYGTTTVHGATGLSLRDFPNFLISCETIDGAWSEPVHLNSSGFDPALFHDDDGRSWMLNMLWDHRPERTHFAGIQIQELRRSDQTLIGAPHTIFTGTARGFTEGPHLYKHEGWYHLLVAEGGTGWDHAVVMARARHLLGPYDIHPDGAVLSAWGAKDTPIARAGHGDLVELADGSPWLAYLCGRPLPDRARCIMGRETAIQPMLWGSDGWLRSLDGTARPMTAAPAPDLPEHRWPQLTWNGRFDGPELPQEFQWLRSPFPDHLFSLSSRPGFLRLYGRETIGSLFEQALVARRQEHFRFIATTCIHFIPRSFQQAAGLTVYYNSTKFYYLFITIEDGTRELQLMCASPELEEAIALVRIAPLPDGPIELQAHMDFETLQFAWRGHHDTSWNSVPQILDASILSDEVTLPGLPNFTGTFVGMACQDLSGAGLPADFAWFVYEPQDGATSPTD